jgi:hypothetical protein
MWALYVRHFISGVAVVIGLLACYVVARLLCEPEVPKPPRGER